ncbi:hypothetical protein CONCODRAFT_3178 [Conidiobolus coronatus NRRL 28638]|uniref:Uncharacterized protein n=1 Tax=Conidiobolus coronatus (strain ATCC 28846 / CBS 209.66 / NRRL 28638) TaxID=796925 RepID=A0A137PFQ4_CONC2|nr:hypothetical protein CONCODRAFT_3178 [Conidiobolus coronatus NRRL 28638]|eukprot:KXN73771.1 hypothetical protein CONCODRAFT_3178 [Conidiobolus coronatus NRRL 28638]
MRFITALVALTAFAAAHEGAHDAQGNHLDAQGNIITFKNGTKPPYPIPPSQQNNSNGNQGQKPYPTPIPNQQPSGNNKAIMDEFYKFLNSPMKQKFVEYMKNSLQNKY